MQEEEARKVHRRSDIAKGLLRTEGEFIPQSDIDAPHFCIAFELLDKTALPQLAQKAIWAINNAVSCVEKGEEGAYIKGIHGLNVINGKKGEKKAIIRVHRGGHDGETRDVLKEVNIQIRIHEAQSNIGGENQVKSHYLFIIASSPLAFSLRLAIYSTLQLKYRGFDAQYADVRRTVWNLLATHVRQGLTTEGQKMHYTRHEVLQAHDTSNVDWIHISSADSFTRLFSVTTSADWVRNHFFAKHPQHNSMLLEGFGTLTKREQCVQPVHISGCMRYDEDINKAIAKTNRKKKRKTPPKQAANQNVVASLADDEDDDNISMVSADDGGADIAIMVPYEYQVDSESPRGYPSCGIAMKVVIPLTLESQPSLYQFYTHAHSFPASVTLDILKKALGIQMMYQDAIVDHEFADTEDDQLLSLAESQTIVCGKDHTLGRPMLSNGDASWAIKCEKNIMSLNGEHTVHRIRYLRAFLRLGFGLALTRSMGSDTYSNERVAQYGKFIEHSSSALSQTECRNTYKCFLKTTSSSRLGCGTHEALRFLEHTLTSCNSMVWSLRPDNLFLLVQMMVSDIMLCLNYHGSVIGGACNGIGATLVVRDGGGSYRRLFKDPSSSEIGGTIGQIYSKRNGSGADTCVGVYKSVVGIGNYDARFKLTEDLISELKRTTELGLMQESCNIVEVIGTENVQTHCVTETMGRKYSTELKAANDPQSQNCMQAITWLVPRNTTSDGVNVFKSTRENEKTKARIPVEYRQVISGYWLLCSNAVGNLSRERFRTLATVSRSVSAAANSLNPNPGLDDSGKKNGEQDSASTTDDAYSTAVIAAARPVFFSSMCTTVVSGFMQWTGMLGKLPASPVLDALIAVFHAQLKLSKDLLNPDMFNQGERPRCLQISKARGVAGSLLAISIQETIDAGRQKKGHQDAIEGTSFKMMIESTSPAIAPWIMADTMEHMFRLDFFILMQLLCQKFQVPNNISLSDLQTWLQTGTSDHCPSLQNWIEPLSGNFVSSARLDKREGVLTEIENCMYITHMSLSSMIQNPNMSFDSTVCDAVGQMLFKQYSFCLAQDCQIHENLSGEEIMKIMLQCNVNQQFTWPAVFGDIDSLPRFWMCGTPPNPKHAESLALCPLRIVIIESKRANLCVDIRWLLLVSTLCGTRPSQASRHLVVGQWIQQFYRHCVPDRMINSQELFIGLPSPVMHGGFICPPIVKSGKKLLRRPDASSSSTPIGTDAPIASGMVEDLGPAAPRYQLAQIIKIPERHLPTDCVKYSFPHDEWTPVRIEIDGTFGSLKTSNDGKFWLMRSDQLAIDITSKDEDVESYLEGRVNMDLRPLCIFDRPGVLLNFENTWTGIAVKYENGRYKILKSDGSTTHLDPFETEDSVVKVGSDVYIQVEAFLDWKDRATFYTEHKRKGPMLGVDVESTAVIKSSISIPQENDNYTEDGYALVTLKQHTSLGATSVAFFGSSQIGSDNAAYTVSKSYNVHISHISVICPTEVPVFLSVYFQ